MTLAPAWAWRPENVSPAVDCPKTTKRIWAAYHVGTIAEDLGIQNIYAEDAPLPLFTTFCLGRKAETGDDWQPIAALLHERLVEIGYTPLRTRSA